MIAQPKSRRGFASMPPDLVRQISSLGGKAAQKKGTAHRWTSQEARAAGKKGGRGKKRMIFIPLQQ